MKIAGTSFDPLLIWKKDYPLTEAVDFATSVAATLARLGSGAYVAHVGKRPTKLLELFEREGCPYSRKVREALSILDLDAIVHPCAPDAKRSRHIVEERLGRFEIPLLIDANTGFVSADSDAIVHYLFERYGDGQVPFALRLGPITNATSRVASLLRKPQTSKSMPSKEPEDLLELYSYEASPYSRLVREVLTKLEISYILHNVARGSAKRPAFIERTGKMQVPYLIDRPRSIEIRDSRAIIRYLEGHFGARA